MTLVSIAAFQFLYLAFLERVELEHKKRIKELEKHCKQLTLQLHNAEIEIAKQGDLIDSLTEKEDEIWADVIEEV